MLYSWIQILYVGLGGVSAAFLYGLLAVVYNLYLHPLAKYPGPKFWAASRIPFSYSLQSGNLCHDTRRIHDKYGHIVRLAPNEISFTDAKAWQDIYGRRIGHAEFTKNTIWTNKAPNGVYPIIDSLEEDHTRQRKALSHAFSPQALKAQESLIQGYIKLLIEKLREEKIANMTDWFNFTTFDVIGDLTFGQSFFCIEKGRYHEWVSFLFSHLKAASVLASIKFFPVVVWILYIFIPKSMFRQAEYHFQMTCGWVHQRLQLKTDRKDFLSYITKNDAKHGMTLPEIEATAATLVLAGSESTSTQLIGTLTHLLQHPAKLSKAKAEIRKTFTSEDDITLEAVEHLSYLRAVFQENFRLAPPVPGQIPRTVPRGGDTICGILFPEKTFVGVPQYAAYRSKLNFSMPDAFIPERWLSPSSPYFKPDFSDPHFDETTFSGDDKTVVQPFSVGPRACPAQFLAHAEMRLVLARLFWNFDVEFPPGDENTKAGMAPWDQQKTYALWVKRPYWIHLMPVSNRQIPIRRTAL